MNPRHHMSATIPTVDIDKFLRALGKSADALREASAKQDYILIDENTWNKFNGRRFVLQAGQHRYAALNIVFQDPAERWWVVRLYASDLSLDALTRLRENVNEVHTALNDGERLLHLGRYQSRLDEFMRDPIVSQSSEGQRNIVELDKSIQLKFQEFDASSVPRARQLFNRLSFRRAILSALEIPGIRAGFSLGSMSDSLGYRAMAVQSLLDKC